MYKSIYKPGGNTGRKKKEIWIDFESEKYLTYCKNKKSNPYGGRNLKKVSLQPTTHASGKATFAEKHAKRGAG